MNTFPVWAQSSIGVVIGIVGLALAWKLIIYPVYRFIGNVIYSIGYHKRMKAFVERDPKGASFVMDEMKKRHPPTHEQLKTLLEERAKRVLESRNHGR